MEKPKKECSNCGSSFTYVRIKSQERVCRMCGNTDELNKETKTENAE